MEASTVAVPRAPVRRSPRLLRTASEERLVALVRAGDAAAFEVVYDRHHRALLSFCRHMLSSAEEGEDAVQQTFLSAHRNLVGSSKPIQLKPWLYAIARNRCLSMLRARREQATGEEIEVATEGLADEVQRRSDLKELLADLRQLPDAQREALVLAEIGSLGHDEIADVIGVPKTKVKALVFQARESLIATKTARETPCCEIREQLSTLHGSALRRGNLRRHLRDCGGCREYCAHVDKQRAALALVIPVIPSLALRHASMPAAVAAKLGGGSGAAGGGLALAGAKGAGVSAKILAAVALAGAGTAGTVVAIDAAGGHRHAPRAGASASSAPSSAPALAAGARGGSPNARSTGAAARNHGAPSRAAAPHAGAAPAAHASAAHAAAARRAVHKRRAGVARSLSASGALKPGAAIIGTAPSGPGRSGTAPGRHQGNSGQAQAQQGTHGRSSTAPGRHQGTHGRSSTAPGRHQGYSGQGGAQNGRSQTAVHDPGHRGPPRADVIPVPPVPGPLSSG